MPYKRRKMRATASGLIAVTPTGPAEGLYVSTSGNDSTGDGTIDFPWRTMTFGITQLASGSGQRLFMRGGTYAETLNSNSLVFPVGTSFSNACTIAAFPNETVNLQRLNLAATSGAGQTVLRYIIFDHLHFIHPGGSESTVSSWGNVHHIRFVSCTATGATNADSGFNQQAGGFAGGGFFEYIDCVSFGNGLGGPGGSGNTGHGFYITTEGNTFLRCESYGNGHLGAQVYNQPYANGDPLPGGLRPSNNTWDSCLFHDNSVVEDGSGAGLVLGQGINNVAKNCIFHSGMDGVRVGYNQPSAGKVYNCTFYGNSGTNIVIQDGATNTEIKNNLVWTNIGSKINVTGAGSGSSFATNLWKDSVPSQDTSSGQAISIATADPKFVNAAAANFHLQSDSPARNAGVNTGVMTDRDGTSRPQGEVWDIGAYEFVEAE